MAAGEAAYVDGIRLLLVLAVSEMQAQTVTVETKCYVTIRKHDYLHSTAACRYQELFQKITEILNDTILRLWVITVVLPHTTDSITAVSPQDSTPTSRYYRNCHLHYRGFPAVFPLSPLPCCPLISTPCLTNSVKAMKVKNAML